MWSAGGGASDGAHQQWLALPQPAPGQARQHHLPADQAATAVQAEYASCCLLPSAAAFCPLLLPSALCCCLLLLPSASYLLPSAFCHMSSTGAFYWAPFALCCRLLQKRRSLLHKLLHLCLHCVEACADQVASMPAWILCSVTRAAPHK